MTKLEIWLDKLPEDKARYYNRTRMSIELFAQKIGYNAHDILQDMKRNGYVYVERERRMKPAPCTALCRLKGRQTTLTHGG